MKYVSWYWKSAGTSAIIRPENPPMLNSTTNAIANSMGASNVIEPPHMVAVQLNTFTPVGTAISMLPYMKNMSAPTGMPTANMWCAHTMNERKAMQAMENTMAL